MNKKSRELTEGALFSTIFLLLLLITVLTPLGTVTLYLLAIPFIIYGYRNGIKMGLIVITASSILSILIGGFYSITLAILAGTVGITMGALYKKGNILLVILGGSITTIINLILGIAFSNLIIGTDIIESLQQMLNASLNSVEGMLKQFGNQQETELIIQAYRALFDNIGLMLPFFIIAFAIMFVIINHVIAGKIMKRLGIKVPNLPPFREWTFPRSIIFYYLLNSIALKIKSLYDIYAIKLIAINLYPLLHLILLIQGLSFVFYYAHQKNLGKTIRVIAIVGILIPFMTQLLIILGMIDISFNLRKKLEI
ncbi:hypothetical protein BHF71_07880 [Vulcanibacillus modesticaldus]|uniref:DUF2232 domain-containing protein n=1 Tax=Vulcanibacillus modesticaldus TaxID=337097 RepID=A0A1D2YVC3_9BACI|nr:DUF2232 domain-containing protein [Vulcanibacillus modesticaldus]OEF99669.1 hypothetical protein BHF71_07880 [Vulcanibacillus modesticaldus]